MTEFAATHEQIAEAAAWAEFGDGRIEQLAGFLTALRLITARDEATRLAAAQTHQAEFLGQRLAEKQGAWIRRPKP